MLSTLTSVYWSLRSPSEMLRNVIDSCQVIECDSIEMRELTVMICVCSSLPGIHFDMCCIWAQRRRKRIEQVTTHTRVTIY